MAKSKIDQAIEAGDWDLAESIVKRKPGLSQVDDMTRSQKRNLRKRIQNDKSHDIGDPDDSMIDPERKEAGKESLRAFYETYFPSVFHLGWSNDHLKIIGKLEQAIIDGELSAIAMPRGSGKTSCVTRACLWALLHGYRRYVPIIAATQDAATNLLNALKTELLHNEILAEDFPWELHAVRSLGGRSLMSKQQHRNNVLTGVQWSVGKVCLGHLDAAETEHTNSGIIQALGLTGGIRGLQETLPSGEIRRPDLVLVDDPSTKQSAGSPSQNRKRLETLNGDVLGLAGPGVSIAGLLTCTVVYENDLADQLLDREANPDWRGERCKLVYKWPTSDDATNLWDEYGQILQDDMREDRGMQRATKFVQDNFDAMHDGAVAGWEDRYDKAKEASAIQHAYNLKLRDEGAFASEYQNEPMSTGQDLPFDLNPELLAKRVIPGLKRNECPEDVEHLVASIDVQKEVLFYTVVGFNATSRGYILDYGTYPDQRRHYFDKQSISSTIQDASGTEDLQGALTHALSMLTSDLMTRDYGANGIEKISIDARWGDSTEIIRRFVRESQWRNQLHPSMGMYIGATSRSWQKLKKSKTDKRGVHAKLTVPTNGGRKEMLLDTNWYKTLVARRLTCTQGGSKALVMFEDTPVRHRMFAEHLSSEVPKISIGKTGNSVTEWTALRRDNDFLDCIVYAHALGSIVGVPFIERKTPAGSNSKAFAKAAEAAQNPSSKVKESARDRMMRRRSR